MFYDNKQLEAGKSATELWRMGTMDGYFMISNIVNTVERRNTKYCGALLYVYLWDRQILMKQLS